MSFSIYIVKHFDTSTTDEMFFGQRFAILAMFKLEPSPAYSTTFLIHTTYVYNCEHMVKLFEAAWTILGAPLINPDILDAYLNQYCDLNH